MQEQAMYVRYNVLHIYIHMYIHTYICTYIHTYVHTYICTLLHNNAPISAMYILYMCYALDACAYVRTYVDVVICACTCVRTSVHVDLSMDFFNSCARELQPHP